MEQPLSEELNDLDLYIQSIFKWFHTKGITEITPEQVTQEMAKDNLPLVPENFDTNSLSESLLRLTTTLIKTEFYVNGHELVRESTETAVSARLEYDTADDGTRILCTVHLHKGIADIYDREYFTNNIEEVL